MNLEQYGSSSRTSSNTTAGSSGRVGGLLNNINNESNNNNNATYEYNGDGQDEDREDINIEMKLEKRQIDEAGEEEEEKEEDKHYINPLGLYLKAHPQRGRGVFTDRLIPAGTIIEEAPVLVLTKIEWEEGKMNDSILGEYGFCWSNGGMAIGLGLASMFNHSSSPNVNFIRNTKSNTISFRTVKTIKPGDELCICYAADESKLWFVDTTAVPSRTRQINGDASDSEQEIFPMIEPDDLGDDNEETTIRRRERQRKIQEGGNVKGKKKRQQESVMREESNVDTTRGLESEDGPSNGDIDLATGSLETQIPVEESAVAPPPGPPAPIPSAESLTIHSPKPIHFSSLSDISLPTVAALGSLPPPLHSTPTISPNTPPTPGEAELVPDLDWRAEDWKGKSGEGEDSGECVRIKGPAEIEESEVENGLMEIWVVDVEDPKLTREILGFSREHDFTELSMKHLKRVTRRAKSEGEEECTSIALCTKSLYTFDQLSSMMAAFHPILASLQPYISSVPRSAARNTVEAKVKSLIWPVNLSPSVNRPSSSAQWTLARREWVKAGIRRILSLALEAKEKGEIPVGVYCSAPPEQFWPTHDGFIQPTIGLRAIGTDTTTSTSHPLRHAILNCVRSIAHLRTVPPFSTAIPTRNGADYLLTSLSLFITHEPCVMCCMALLHSRVREVFYIFPRKRGGGFESGLGIHGRKDLNHRYEVWRWDGEVEKGVREKLEVDDGIAI